MCLHSPTRHRRPWRRRPSHAPGPAPAADVEFAGLDYLVSTTSGGDTPDGKCDGYTTSVPYGQPNDPRLGDSWGLVRSSAGYAWGNQWVGRDTTKICIIGERRALWVWAAQAGLRGGSPGGLRSARMQLRRPPLPYTSMPGWRLACRLACCPTPCEPARLCDHFPTDSGVDCNHPEFKVPGKAACKAEARFEKGIQQEGPGAAFDAWGHGTKIAGVVAAAGNNGVLTAGVMYQGVSTRRTHGRPACKQAVAAVMGRRFCGSRQ